MAGPACLFKAGEAGRTEKSRLRRLDWKRLL
jgi:hypothetical protein